MHRRPFFGLFVLAIVGMLIVGICGFSMLWQGYALSALSASEGVAGPTIVVGSGFSALAWGMSMLFRFACLSLIFMMMLGVTAKFLRLWYWQANGQSEGGKRCGHHRWRHHRYGQRPPWVRHDSPESTEDDDSVGEGGVA